MLQMEKARCLLFKRVFGVRAEDSLELPILLPLLPSASVAGV